MSSQRGYKVQCNGNDFIILIKEDLEIIPDKPFIQNLCNRDTGIGADGMLLITKSVDGYDFKMDYFNNDGSWETMCANGALCTIKLLLNKRHLFTDNLFLAGDGDHGIRIEDQEIYIRMKPPSLKTEDMDIQGNIGAHVDSGAKHFVMQSDITDIDKIYKIAQIIRYDDSFAPNGLNVNLLRIDHKAQIQVITYEKGIEKVMQSCGSGSVAAAFYASTKTKMKSPLTIINRGGEMELQFDEMWRNVWLRSNPTLEFEVEI